MAGIFGESALKGLGQAVGGIVDSVGGGLFGSLLGGIGSRRQYKNEKKLMALQNEYFKEQSQFTAALNRQQYDYEYEKESPSATARRLRAAGLNPALMYGTGNAGVQAAVGTSSANPPSGHAAGFATGLASLGVSPVDQSIIRANDAKANESNARAQDILGQTPEAMARINNIVEGTNLSIAERQLQQQFLENARVQEDIMKLQKIREQYLNQSMNKKYVVRTVSATGDISSFQIEGKYLDNLIKSQEYIRGLYDNHKDSISVRNYAQEYSLHIAASMMEIATGLSLVEMQDALANKATAEATWQGYLNDYEAYLKQVREDALRDPDGARKDDSRPDVKLFISEIDYAQKVIDRYRRRGYGTQLFFDFLSSLPFSGGASYSHVQRVSTHK